MKIFFVGVFTPDNRSTNDSQLVAFRHLGHEVTPYNFRKAVDLVGSIDMRDTQLISEVKTWRPDLVVFSKGATIDIRVVKECSKISKICLWFMDAFIRNHWSPELVQRIQHCTYVCCDKLQAVAEGLKYNPRTYQVYEGFDSFIDKPYELPRDIPISFIGDPYDNRRAMCDFLSAQVFQNVYGEEHAKIVSRSLINLNLCTADCASDRVYKILGAGGLLFSDDWEGREEQFEDGKDLVIFKDAPDLAQNVRKYMDNLDLAEEVRQNGLKTVQKYSRIEWAKEIVKYV